MFWKNEGTIDRIVRVALGLLLIAAYFLTSGGSNHWLYLIGIGPLVTGLLGTCPIYSLLGMSTYPMKKV